MLTNYTPGADGKTPWGRRRDQRCGKPLAQIGEKVIYLPLKTASIHEAKAQPRMQEGIWLGANARTEEVFIGTALGVAKCRTFKRLPDSEGWNAKKAHGMRGTTWQPVPGYRSDHVPVEINDKGVASRREAEDAPEKEEAPMEEDIDAKPKVRASKITDFRVAQKELIDYGPTIGCKACDHASQSENTRGIIPHERMWR